MEGLYSEEKETHLIEKERIALANRRIFQIVRKQTITIQNHYKTHMDIWK